MEDYTYIQNHIDEIIRELSKLKQDVTRLTSVSVSTQTSTEDIEEQIENTAVATRQQSSEEEREHGAKLIRFLSLAWLGSLLSPMRFRLTPQNVKKVYKRLEQLKRRAGVDNVLRLTNGSQTDIQPFTFQLPKKDVPEGSEEFVRLLDGLQMPDVFHEGYTFRKTKPVSLEFIYETEMGKAIRKYFNLTEGGNNFLADYHRSLTQRKIGKIIDGEFRYDERSELIMKANGLISPNREQHTYRVEYVELMTLQDKTGEIVGAAIRVLRSNVRSHRQKVICARFDLNSVEFCGAGEDFDILSSYLTLLSFNQIAPTSSTGSAVALYDGSMNERGLVPYNNNAIAKNDVQNAFLATFALVKAALNNYWAVIMGAAFTAAWQATVPFAREPLSHDKLCKLLMKSAARREINNLRF